LCGAAGKMRYGKIGLEKYGITVCLMGAEDIHVPEFSLMLLKNYLIFISFGIS